MQIYRERYIQNRQMFVRYTRHPSLWAYLRQRMIPMITPRPLNARLLCLDTKRPAIYRAPDSNWLRQLIFRFMPRRTAIRSRLLERV